MKNITFLFSVLCAICTDAQVIYPSSDFADQGDTFTVTTAAGFLPLDFAATGASQSWDYSTLTAESTSDAVWLNPNDTGYKTGWCFLHLYIFNCDSQFNGNFNLAALATEGFSLDQFEVTNVMSHMHKNTAHLETRMIGATIDLAGTPIPISVDYDTPDVVYQFPITFGDDYSNTSELNVDFSAFGIPASIAGTTVRTNQVDGWGSLITPAATYANTLKMKTTLVTDQTVTYEGTEMPIQTTVIQYTWFDPSFGMPVLQATGSEVNGNFVPARVTFLGESLHMPENALSDMTIYPNPTTGELFLSRDISISDVSVFDIRGVKVGNMLDISNLDSGIYFVKVSAEEGSFTRKIIKT